MTTNNDEATQAAIAALERSQRVIRHVLVNGKLTGAMTSHATTATHEINAALALLTQSPRIEDRAAGDVELPMEIEAIVVCLGDDAAQIRHKNPDDEVAQNMEDAAKLIRSLCAAIASATPSAAVGEGVPVAWLVDGVYDATDGPTFRFVSLNEAEVNGPGHETEVSRTITPLYTIPTKPGHMVVEIDTLKHALKALRRGANDTLDGRIAADDIENLLNTTQGGKGEGE